MSLDLTAYVRLNTAHEWLRFVTRTPDNRPLSPEVLCRFNSRGPTYPAVPSFPCLACRVPSHPDDGPGAGDTFHYLTREDAAEIAERLK